MKTLLLIVLFALPVSLFAQTNTAAYDQLMTLAGTFISNGNLDAAKQTAQQALQLDSQQWRGNALMAAILEKQGDFTNAQVYVLKAIAAAPADKLGKLSEMAKTIAASAAQGASSQQIAAAQSSPGPAGEQTIAWMKEHLADLACDIRVSGSYDATGSCHTGGGREIFGVNTDIVRCYGNRAATYALIPMGIVFTNNILILKIFELHEYRFSGTRREENDFSAAPEDNRVDNNTDLSKTSQGVIHTLSINLGSVSIASDISEVRPAFRFDNSYLIQPDPPPVPKDESHPVGLIDDDTAFSAAEDEPYRTDIAAYQNNKSIYWLVIHGNESTNNISDSVLFANVDSGDNGIFIGFSDNSTIHNYTNLPPEVSSPPGFWTDPNQDANDLLALKDWISENCQKQLPSGDSDSPNTPFYPSAIAICNTDKNVLEQWRKAFQRLIELNNDESKANNSNAAVTRPFTYDELLTQAGMQIASSDLEGAKKTAQQLLQMDSQRWQGNALMAWILDQQGDFAGGDHYILKTTNRPKPCPFKVFAWTGGTMRIKDIRAIVPIPAGAKLAEDSQ